MSGRTELPSGLVTFMFTDIEGSTRLARMLGETYGTVLGAHRSVLRAALSDFGGYELFTEGDSFFVAFGDASAAIAACVAAQRALASHDWPSPDARPRVRMGLHTGWARPGNGEYVSPEVHRAARVAAAAHGGQVLCSEATALAAATWPTEITAESIWPADPESVEAADGPMTGIDLLDLGVFKLRGFDDAERLFQLVAPELEHDFPRPRTPGAPTNNLPAPVTSFLGRRAEVHDLTELIGRHRLVTVAGAGGSGKTRLALAAAETLLTAYPEGVWLVDAVTATAALTVADRRAAQIAAPPHPLATPAQRAGVNLLAVSLVDEVGKAVAGALGLRTEPGRWVIDTITEQCAGRRMLLIIDTCDVAPTAVTDVVRRLLAACPEMDVLATSRQPLGVAGEVVWRIPPLAPDDALSLLIARTSEARGGRQVPRPEHGDLARVVSGLDGSPLAIELAAARLRVLSGGQLAGRLDDPLGALDAGREGTADRHGSLTANLDWSYRTLGDRASGLLRRLAVFAGPIDLAAVEWCGDDALGGLTELAEKSLVDVLPGPSFRLSAPVRGYAARRLLETCEESAARDRHVAWALHTLDVVAVDTDGQPRTVSLSELAPNVVEWQAALRWAATGGNVRAGFRLATALDPWWREHGGANEGRDLLYRLYGRLSDEHIAPAELGGAYLVHAGLADDRDERDRFLCRAEEVARRADHPGLLVRALAGRRVGLLERRDEAGAERVCRDVIARAERTGVPGAALPAVTALAELLLRRDALDEAAELLGGARQIEAGRPEDRGRRTVDWLLGLIALRRGDLVAAHDHLVVALRSRLRYGFRGAAADAVTALAVRCAMGGDPLTAAVLFGGSEGVRGARRTAMFGGFWSEQQAGLRAVLGDAAFDVAYADGADQGFDRIVAAALAVEHPDLEHGSARFAQTLQ